VLDVPISEAYGKETFVHLVVHLQDPDRWMVVRDGEDITDLLTQEESEELLYMIALRLYRPKWEHRSEAKPC
jgi:hypothetical protein